MFAIVEWKAVIFTDEIISENSIVYNIVPVLLMIMFVSLVFNKGLLESLCLSLCASVLTAVAQCVAVVIWSIFELLLSADIDYETRVNFMQIIYVVLFAIFLVVFKGKIYKFSGYIQKWITYKSKNRIVFRLISCFFIVATTMVLFCYAVYKDISNLTTFFYASITILITLTFVVTWYLETLKRTYEIEHLREQAKAQEIHNDFVQKVNKFSHSYNNLMQVLTLMLTYDECSKEQFQDIKAAVNDIIEWNKDNDLNYTLKYVNIPNIVISSILSIKDKYAESMGVKFTVLRQGNGMLTLNSKDCIDTLTILLDNAIQCACMCDNKEVIVDLDFGKKIFSCKITNDFLVDENNNVVKETTSHGYGIKSVEDIVKRNNKFTYNTRVEGNKYIALFKYKNTVGDK